MLVVMDDESVAAELVYICRHQRKKARLVLELSGHPSPLPIHIHTMHFDPHISPAQLFLQAYRLCLGVASLGAQPVSA